MKGISPNSNVRVSKDPNGDAVHFKKNIGYYEGFNFILGVVIGSGIFISPTGVIHYSHHNVAMALSVWVACGLLSMMAALCFAELGVTLPSSGGSYFYIKRALGSVPAFIHIWTISFLLSPASLAARAFTFTEYALQPFYSECSSPDKTWRLSSTNAQIFGYTLRERMTTGQLAILAKQIFHQREETLRICKSICSRDNLK
uniref:Uncharacterized protein n=1 Tax=Erpetoichthys calabaricus TaxID=27687 RepID=A0A8C4RSD4_ERPCA